MKRKFFVALLTFALAASSCSVALASSPKRNLRSQAFDPNMYERSGVLRQSRIESDWSMPNGGGNWEISRYNHPVDNYQIASAMAYVYGYLGGNPEYFSWNETCFYHAEPSKIWESLWAFEMARPVERLAFGSAVVENVTVEGFRVLVKLNVPNVWGIMNEKAPDLPESVRQWLFMDALSTGAGPELSDLPRMILWLEMFIDETGRFRMSPEQQRHFLETPENDLREALMFYAKAQKWSPRAVPAFAEGIGAQVRVSNRTVRLPRDIEMGLALLGDGKRPGVPAPPENRDMMSIRSRKKAARYDDTPDLPNTPGVLEWRATTPRLRSDGDIPQRSALPGPNRQLIMDPGWQNPGMEIEEGVIVPARRLEPVRVVKAAEENTEVEVKHAEKKKTAKVRSRKTMIPRSRIIRQK